MQAKKILISGILGGIAILVISMALSLAFQAVFAFNVLTLAGMRAVNDPVMILFFLHPFVVSFTVAILYEKTKKAFSGTTMQKGLLIGLLAWLVSSIQSAFLVFSTMDYPIGFTVNSIISPLIYMVAAGIIIAKIQE